MSLNINPHAKAQIKKYGSEIIGEKTKMNFFD